MTCVLRGAVEKALKSVAAVETALGQFATAAIVTVLGRHVAAMVKAAEKPQQNFRRKPERRTRMRLRNARSAAAARFLDRAGPHAPAVMEMGSHLYPLLHHTLMDLLPVARCTTSSSR